MAEDVLLSIDDLDFHFENMPVRVVANRSCPEIKVASETIGPLEEGKEFEVRYWIARELVEAGIAHFHDADMIDIKTLHRIHWRETIQTARQTSTIPEDFYPKLRRYLADLKDKVATGSSFAREEYDRAVRLAYDIVGCRLRKIVALAAAPAQTDSTLRSLSKEEKFLYNQLFNLISSWRSKIIRLDF